MDLCYKKPSLSIENMMNYQIRPIQIQGNAAIAEIIRTVSLEFGLAAQSGFAVADPILDQLFQFYQQPYSAYWVIADDNGTIYGGGGISPLQGDPSILEIQKMYFLPQLRGFGFAQQLLEKCITFAQENHFISCYLETTQTLWQAIKLYEKLGFEHLSTPQGNTGHSQACEVWMMKTL